MSSLGRKSAFWPKADSVLTFDRLSSVFLSNTNHEEDQPVHLQVKDMALQKSSEHDIYAGPSTRYCPAGVCEWVEKDGQETYVINAQNCVQCKTCDIKDPNQNINWVPPQGARRAGLSEYVTVASTLPPTWQTSGSLTVTRGQHSHQHRRAGSTNNSTAGAEVHFRSTFHNGSGELRSIAEFREVRDLKNQLPRGSETDPTEPRQWSAFNQVGSIQHVDARRSQSICARMNVVDFKTKMHAADLLRGPLRSAVFPATIFKQLDTRPFAATQEHQIAYGRLCGCAQLFCHEILVDIEVSIDRRTVSRRRHSGRRDDALHDGLCLLLRLGY